MEKRSRRFVSWNVASGSRFRSVFLFHAMSNNPDEANPSENGAGHAEDANGSGETSDSNAYWKANLKLLAVLMAIWFAVSFGAGIMFRPFLDQYMLGGYPLGFWFAQQGSTYIFIALIFVYSFAIRRLERKFGLAD